MSIDNDQTKPNQVAVRNNSGKSKSKRSKHVKVIDSTSAKEYLQNLLEDLHNGTITDKQAKAASFLIQTLASVEKRIFEESKIASAINFSMKKFKVESHETFMALLQLVRYNSTEEIYNNVIEKFNEMSKSLDLKIEVEIEELKKRIKKQTSFSIIENSNDDPAMIVEDIKTKMIDLPPSAREDIEMFIRIRKY